MEQFLRVVAVLLEVAVLGIMMLCLFWGLRLLLTELGVNQKYDRAVGMALTVLWSIVTVFFAMHLSAFYPSFEGVMK